MERRFGQPPANIVSTMFAAGSLIGSMVVILGGCDLEVPVGQSDNETLGEGGVPYSQPAQADVVREIQEFSSYQPSRRQVEISGIIFDCVQIGPGVPNAYRATTYIENPGPPYALNPNGGDTSDSIVTPNLNDLSLVRNGDEVCADPIK